MSTAIHFDQPVGGRIRRALGYGGAVNVTSPSPTSVALVMFARELISDAFGGRDPELAQFDLPAADHDAIVGGLTRRFSRHPESARLIRNLLIERGCDPETTFVDVPRLCATVDDVVSAAAWRPCRDTWCCAPPAQLDHWIPVYAVDDDDAMTLYPQYFSQAIPNDSAGYDYAVADDGAHHVTQPPGPIETVDPFAATAVVTPVGGVLQFSGQHLHCSTPTEADRTRFTVEFASVDVDDVRAGLGARNVDGRCTGSTIRDFARVADHAPVPGDVVDLLDRDRPAFTRA